jgi:alpha-galactosidase
LKIVAIGAGSSNFSLVTLADILRAPELQESSLYLVDINEEALFLVFKLAKILKKHYNSKIDLYKSTDRKKILENADFVILIVAENMESTWESDFNIAKRHGIWHYAENGGPGAFGHTVRNITLCMPIFQDIKDLAPNSWLINFTNPLPRIHYAAEGFFNLKCISFCHQYWHGYYIIGRILSEDLKIDPSESYQKLRNKALRNYKIKAAGINHFTWAIEIKRKSDNQNLYPLLRRKVDTVPRDFEYLTRHVYKTYNIFPMPGETHLSEYLPYTTRKDQWDKYNLYPYNFVEGKKNRTNDWIKIKSIISGKIAPSIFQPNQSERLANILIGLIDDLPSYEPALNIKNNGAIVNLPSDAIVEVPANISKNKVDRQVIGKLPEAISALCSREISIAKMITEASIKGNKDLVLQAFALDPMINDLSLAEKLVDDYLSSFSNQVPQFK